MTFSLVIDMENDAMQTTEELTRALRKVANQLDQGSAGAPIRDENGNRVGRYEFSRVNEARELERDDVISLPSGTEISIDAALGDISRAINALPDDRDDLHADLSHVAELVELLAAKVGS